MIRILIVADIRLYREGLAQILGERGGIAVVGTAADRPGALESIRGLNPDVVLLDMATPDSRLVVQDLASVAPDTRVVALSVAEVEEHVLACAEAGVAGYVRREASVEDLVAAVESAARGEILCSPRLAGSLWRRLAALAARQEPAPPRVELTRREQEILRLIEQDLSNKEIACQLGIELATVKNHVHNLLDKLGVHRRTEAARLLGKAAAVSAPRVREPVSRHPPVQPPARASETI